MTIEWLKKFERFCFPRTNMGTTFHASNLHIHHFSFDHELIGYTQFIGNEIKKENETKHKTKLGPPT